MHTSLDCLPCFLRQALKAARVAAPDNGAAHEATVRAWAAYLAEADLTRPAPCLAGDLYPMATRLAGVDDPYAAHKHAANTRVLDLLPGLAGVVAASPDPLHAALALAIIGNYIDAGVDHAFDWEHALADETHVFSGAHGNGDAYTAFAHAACDGARVLILGDNAGEIGLDTLLVRQLKGRGCAVTYAVRGAPILNDATLEDAAFVGMDALCEVVSSGSDAPGTVRSRVTPGFAARMADADCIVSKGQGNLESLYGTPWPGLPPVYYAFKAKCPVIATKLHVREGASLFISEPAR
ncbi:MAG: DUF89 domain-containing protein [Desulfovibrionaceae bacterium]